MKKTTVISVSILIALLAGCVDEEGTPASDEPTTTTAQASTVVPGTLVRGLTFPWGTKTRLYDLYVPSSYNPARSDGYKLVVSLHGRDIFPNGDMATLTPLVSRAEAQGFIAVFPIGTYVLNPSANPNVLVWNVGEPNCDFKCTPATPYCINNCVYESIEDDEGFIIALIDDLATTLAINKQRVLLTGISIGGQLAIMLGCTHADRFKAIAPVAGPVYGFGPYYMPYNRPAGCSPSRPLQVIDFVGTIDSVYGTHAPAKVAHLGPGVEGCLADPSSTLVAHEGWLDVYRRNYRTCTPGATEESYVINNGTHCWPGGNNAQLCAGNGNVAACLAIMNALCTKTFVADDEMLRFFNSRD
jgi:poly(3-hydroxybutyrate) depolymerase